MKAESRDNLRKGTSQRAKGAMEKDSRGRARNWNTV